MINEKKYQIRIIIACVVAVLCSGFYAWGGMEHKWLRRYLASFIYTLTLSILMKDFRAFLFYPFLALGLSFGYGAESTIQKIFLRFISGTIISIGALTAFSIFWRKYVVQVVCSIIICASFIYLGVINPFNDIPAGARLEEFIIGLSIFTIPLLVASVGGTDDKS